MSHQNKCAANCRCGKHDQAKQRRVLRSYPQHRTGISYAPRPSENFDWDAAIKRHRRMLKQVYGY